MTQVQSLWPDTLGKINVSPPVQILAGQAEYFNALVKNVLIAKVTSHTENNGWSAPAMGGNIYYRLQIQVPAINYVLNVLTMHHHGLKDLYPVKLYDAIRDKEFEGIPDQQALIGKLRDILSSHELDVTISSLLSQIEYLAA